MTKVLDCDLEESDFELSRVITFTFILIPLRKVWTPLLPSYDLGSTTTVLERWLWHQITHENWYDIKQKTELKPNQDLHLSDFAPTAKK